MYFSLIMKKILLLFCCHFFLWSQPIKWKEITIDSLHCRALSYDSESKKVWFASHNGVFGYYDLNTNKIEKRRINYLDLKPNFRGIAQTKSAIFLMSIASPGLIFKISKSNIDAPTIVYLNNDRDFFLDAIHFISDTIGFAVGDPHLGYFTLLKTIDGGESWQKLPFHQDLLAKKGEALFASSNTSLQTIGQRLHFFTGGLVSRHFTSLNYGESWQHKTLPILSGKLMTGVYGASFFDEKNGFIVGGDYEVATLNKANKAITRDGGTTWQLIADETAFGYASAIAYARNSKGNVLVTVGKTGVFHSKNGGKTWQKINNDSNLYCLININASTFVSAGKNKLVVFSL